MSLLLLLMNHRMAGAMTETEFQSRAQALRSQQTQTDTLLKRLGAGSGFTPIDPTRNARDEAPPPLFRVHSDFSNAKLPVGKLLYGKILNRLVVGPDGSPVLIVLDSDQGQFSNLRVIGTARQSGTEGRVSLELTRLLYPSGKSIPLQGIGLDMAGSYGIEAQIFSSKALQVAGAMASSFIAGAAASQQEENVNALGFTTPKPTGRNAILQGVAQTAADQSKRLIEEATSEKPILVIETQESIAILLQDEHAGR